MLHYSKIGTEKEILVLLHGFLENSTIWEDMLPYLLPHFTIITIDLPGHGLSDSLEVPLTMQNMAEEVSKIIEVEKLGKIHLLGHSMGGYVALALAEKQKVHLKSLTLFFSTYLSDSEDKKLQRQKSHRIIMEAFPHYIKAGIPNLFSPHVDHNEKINTAIKIAQNTQPKAALACQKGMAERPDSTSLVASLDCKILLLSGKYDTAIDLKNTLEKLPKKQNCIHHQLDCGHNGHWEKPIQCAEIIIQELL